MDSYNLNLCARRGVLNQERRIVPWDGPFLTISSSRPNDSRYIRFTRSAVDINGLRFAAGDNQGNIYVFDPMRNKYWFVCRIDRSYSCISFTPKKEIDLLVASSDCALHFIDSETCTVRKTFQKHKSCVNHISLDTTGKRALTSSLDVAVLWDLDQLSLLHVLQNKKAIDIVKAFFLPIKDYLVTSFKEGTVYLWDSENLSELSHFNCHQTPSFWLKAIDGSKDGNFIICCGKRDIMLLWNVEKKVFENPISFSDYLSSVKHVAFLSPLCNLNPILAALSSSGSIHFVDVKTSEHFCELKDDNDKVVSFHECNGKMAVISSSGKLKLYNLENILQNDKKVPSRISIPEPCNIQEQKVHPKSHGKPKPEGFVGLSIRRLLFILDNYGQYPTKHRNVIWCTLLKLPFNKEYAIYYKAKSSPLNIGSFDIPAKKDTIRMLHMLKEWCPVLETVDFLPLMIAPFVKLFGKNRCFCFELLVTYITSWCQNWFLYLPHKPFNIIFAIDNMILYHDRRLFHHFLLHGISPEVYAFTLLQASFFSVLDEDQWLQLWDHIFSNPPEFLVYIVVAFILKSRKIFFTCHNDIEVKAFFQSHSVIALSVVDEAKRLRSITPLCFKPTLVVGPFKPLSKDGYPVFRNFSVVKYNFPTLLCQRALDSGIEHMKLKKKELESRLARGSEEEKSALAELRLLEMMRYHKIMEDYIRESFSEKQVQELEILEEKMKKLQKLMQKLLITSPEDDEGCKTQTEPEAEILFERHPDSEENEESSSPCMDEHSESDDSTVWDILRIRDMLSRDSEN